MKIVFGLNVPRNKADRVDLNAMCASVTNGLRADGISLAYPVKAQNNALEGTVASLLSGVVGQRSILKVGLAVPETQISAPVMRNISARCLNAMMHSTGYLSQVTAALNALPPNGSGGGGLNLIGEPGGVSRTVSQGTDEPFLGTDNAVSGSTVVNTNGTRQQPGDTNPSGISNAASSASDALGTLRTPLIVVGVAVSLVAIVLAARKVL